MSKLFAAPYSAAAVLIVDPVTNATDTTTLAVSSANGKWIGIVFAPVVNKLFAAPHFTDAVLIVDPVANTTDTTTLAGLGSGVGKWTGIAFAPIVNKLFAAPYNSDAVLIVDPVANSTDTTTLAGLGSGGEKWNSLAFAPIENKLFASPPGADAVLIVDTDFFVDFNVLLPLHRVTELSGSIVATRSAMSATQSELSASRSALSSSATAQSSMHSALVLTESTLSTTQTALSSSITAQLSIETQMATFATQSELSTVGSSVCNQPVCAEGTQASNLQCVLDCDNLRRRGVSCEAHCEANGGGGVTTVGDNGGGGSGGSSIVGLVVGVALGVVIAVAAVAVYQRHQSARREPLDALSPRANTVSMFVNPLHQGPPVDYEEPATLHAAHGSRDSERRTTTLDSDMYVASTGGGAGFNDTGGLEDPTYAGFRSPGSDGASASADASMYKVFRSVDRGADEKAGDDATA